MPVISGYSAYAEPYITNPYADPYYAGRRQETTLDPRTTGNVTTYKVKPATYAGSDRGDTRQRRLTVDSTARPTIIHTEPRSAIVHGDRSSRDVYDSGRGYEDYYATPASSRDPRDHRAHRHSSLRPTDDYEPSHRLAPSRREPRYPRSRPTYPGSSSRRGDPTIDDDDAYSYMHPGALVQYDLDHDERPRRRDSYGHRHHRPTSVAGYEDVPHSSYDHRDRGPPPSRRGLDSIAAASGESTVRAPRNDRFVDEPREYRRPTVVYHSDMPRDDGHESTRDVEARRDIPHRTRRHGDEREDRSKYDRRDAGKKTIYDRDAEYEAHDSRSERRSGKAREKPYHRDDDRTSDREDPKERKPKKDVLAKGISLAAAALGIDVVAKHTGSDEEKEKERRRRREDDDHRKPNGSDEEKEERRRRRQEDDRRRRRDSDEKDNGGMSTKDKRDSASRRGDKDATVVDSIESTSPEDSGPPPLDLSGRNPQEKRHSPDHKEDTDSSKDGQIHTPPDSDDDAHGAGGDKAPRRRRRHGSAATFDPKNATDIRALQDALKAGDKTPTDKPSSLKPAHDPRLLDRAMREGSFERKSPEQGNETAQRDDRGRNSNDADRPHIRVVSPPREIGQKPPENKPKGILRPPREKFPEDPVAIREGVAPLKDAKKDGIPPDARWTKISRRMVNPEALEAGKERFEAREDFVIVLRVLTKEEIQAYAAVTQQIRGMSQYPLAG
jgi:hypothetical protein